MVIDLLVGFVLLVSALISFLRGFIREVLTIFGTVGALAAAYYAGPVLEPLMRGWLGVKEGEPVPELFDIIPYTIVAQIMAYGGVFLIVLIVLSIVSHILAETVRKIGLGSVDRTLGVVFGLARGFFILALIYIPLKLFAGQERMDGWFEGSKAHVYIDAGASWLTGLLPENTLSAPDAEPSEDQAREKLDKMKLINPELAKKIEDALKEGLNPAEILKNLPQAGEAGKALEKGYTEEFRKQMDDLFKDKNKSSAAPSATPNAAPGETQAPAAPVPAPAAPPQTTTTPSPKTQP